MADEKNRKVFVKDKPVTIYALIDPRDGLTRYIGKTENSVLRLRGHFSEARKTDSPKSRWLKSLLWHGLLPIVETLEVVFVGGNWAEAEKRHIANYRVCGVALLNRSDGGEGVIGAERTEEWGRNGAEARRASPVWWEAVNAAAERRKGIPLTPDHKAAISAANAGRKFPPEFGAKISAAQKGRPANPKSIEGAHQYHLGRKETDEIKEKKRIAMEKHREAQSERQRRNWEDPEYRTRVSASMRNRAPISDITHQKLSAAQVALWRDPAERAKREAGLRKAAARKRNTFLKDI